jgi:hypothetical protein
MTSLAKQLNALRQEIQLPQKSIPSLLFSPDDAFHVESSLIYNLSTFLTRLSIISRATQN